MLRTLILVVLLTVFFFIGLFAGREIGLKKIGHDPDQVDLKITVYEATDKNARNETPETAPQWIRWDITPSSGELDSAICDVGAAHYRMKIERKPNLGILKIKNQEDLWSE